MARSTLSYALRMPAKDAPVIEALRALSSQYPRYDYRRMRIFLRRAGHDLCWERTHRLWRKAGLQLPRQRPRPVPAAGPNFVLAYDFVFDACANGQQIKCLTIAAEFTRECLAIDVAGSIRSRRVIEVLTQLISNLGAPRYLRSDNGPEFVSRASWSGLPKPASRQH